MSKRLWLTVVLVGLAAFGVVSCAAPYLDPPPNLEMDDLAGIWQARYIGGGEDTLVIRGDGTFKQEYRHQERNNTWDSGWNQWYLEPLPSGSLRMHLEGARSYLYGSEFAEREVKPLAKVIDRVQDNTLCVLHGPVLLMFQAVIMGKRTGTLSDGVAGIYKRMFWIIFR